LDINFGLVREVYYDSAIEPITITDNNLYNKYHSKFIREITDKDSKIVEAWVHMTALDFKLWSFRDLYYFDNSYFRLNEIKGFNPTSQDLTKCEFLKLKEVSPFTPTLIVLDGDGSPFTPATDDGVSGDGVIGIEYKPTVNVSRASKHGGNTYNAQATTVQGTNNNVSLNAYDVNILGDGNTVYSGAKGIEIINGDNNIINSGVQNVTLINTSGVTIEDSNVTYIDGVVQGEAGWLTKSSSFTTDTTITGYYLVGGASLLTVTLDSTEGGDFIFKRVDTTIGSVTIVDGAAATIDGQVNATLLPYDSIRLRWNEELNEYSIVN
jgi:hypothetical protein